MKYLVKAIINFNDLKEKTNRKIGDEWECEKARMEFLLEHKAIEVIDEIKEKVPIVENVEESIERIEQSAKEQVEKLFDNEDDECTKKEKEFILNIINEKVEPNNPSQLIPKKIQREVSEEIKEELLKAGVGKIIESAKDDKEFIESIKEKPKKKKTSKK